MTDSLQELMILGMAAVADLDFRSRKPEVVEGQVPQQI
jgi:hypothetical protein